MKPKHKFSYQTMWNFTMYQGFIGAKNSTIIFQYSKKTYKYNKNIIRNYNVACNCKNEST